VKIGLVPLVAPVSGPRALGTHAALEALAGEFDFAVVSPDEMGAADLPAFLIRTGGTEGLFQQALAALPASRDPLTLLAVDRDNSLPASLEILAWLQGQGHRNARILLLTAPDAARRLHERALEVRATRALAATRLGVVGRPSDWLIASQVDPDRVRHRWGVELVDLDLAELDLHLEAVSEAEVEGLAVPAPVQALEASRVRPALRIYLALKSLVQAHGLTALTLRCFDLLEDLRATGCLALALLNDEGLVAGCEGDVPTTFTMLANRLVTGEPSFMANPSRLEGDEVVLAHCTAPLSMLTGYTCPSHFESDLGVAVAGNLAQGPVTLSRFGGADLGEGMIYEGDLVDHVPSPHLCRTQVRARVQGLGARLLEAPLGNHLVVSPGHHKTRLEALLALGKTSGPGGA
jgi:L-fucose isomerase-like protein